MMKVILSSDLTKPAVRGLYSFNYPFYWGANNFEILLALCRLGQAHNNFVLKLVTEILNKADTNKGFKLDKKLSNYPRNVGVVGKENKWITFYMYLLNSYYEKRPLDE